MKIIAHRGNINGRNPERENSPDYILEALALGFDVEVDVWFVEGKFYLGHDEPVFKTDTDFLRNPKLWCHAKNTDALHELLKANTNCFWHENDSFTLTSRGTPWCFPGKWISGGVTVVFSNPSEVNVPDFIGGVCVDNPLAWVELI